MLFRNATLFLAVRKPSAGETPAGAADSSWYQAGLLSLISETDAQRSFLSAVAATVACPIAWPDLIDALYHIAGSVEPRYARALVLINDETPFLGYRRPEIDSQTRTHL
jgi:hypothetical protein